MHYQKNSILLYKANITPIGNENTYKYTPIAFEYINRLRTPTTPQNIKIATTRTIRFSKKLNVSQNARYIINIYEIYHIVGSYKLFGNPNAPSIILFFLK